MTPNGSVLVVPLMVLALLLAGCHEAVSPPEGWVLRGDLHETTTQDDLDAIEAALQGYQATMLVLESFPMQYEIKGPHVDDCEVVRGMLFDHEAVATVGSCETHIAG